jgi:hypothetical protein
VLGARKEEGGRVKGGTRGKRQVWDFLLGRNRMVGRAEYCGRRKSGEACFTSPLPDTYFVESMAHYKQKNILYFMPRS